MTSITRVFIISEKNLDFFFVILGPFENFPHYPCVDFSHWLKTRRPVGHRYSLQRIDYGLNSLTLSSRISADFFWFLPVFVLKIIALIVKSH